MDIDVVEIAAGVRARHLPRRRLLRMRRVVDVDDVQAPGTVGSDVGEATVLAWVLTYAECTPDVTGSLNSDAGVGWSGSSSV